MKKHKETCPYSKGAYFLDCDCGFFKGNEEQLTDVQKERNFWINSLEDLILKRKDKTFGETTNLGAFMSAIKEEKTQEEKDEIKEIVKEMD